MDYQSSCNNKIKFGGHYLRASMAHLIIATAFVELRVHQSWSDVSPMTRPTSLRKFTRVTDQQMLLHAGPSTRWSGAMRAVFTTKSNHMSSLNRRRTTADFEVGYERGRLSYCKKNRQCQNSQFVYHYNPNFIKTAPRRLVVDKSSTNLSCL